MPRRIGKKGSMIVLEAITKFWMENSYSPSIRDLVNLTPYKSTSVIMYFLRQLEDNNLIHRSEGVSRAIVPVGLKIEFKEAQ